MVLLRRIAFTNLTDRFTEIKSIPLDLWNYLRAEHCPFEGLSVVDETAYPCDL